jgi:hypothetical protein
VKSAPIEEAKPESPSTDAPSMDNGSDEQVDKW